VADVQATHMDVGRYAYREVGGRVASGTSGRGQRMERLPRRPNVADWMMCRDVQVS
jgi:hypothetical protein